MLRCMHRSRRGLTAAVALIALATGAPRARGDALRADVFLCEDAIARARKCCPDAFDMPPPTTCDYDPGGCGAAGHDPEITEVAARCVISASCDELRQNRCNLPLPCP